MAVEKKRGCGYRKINSYYLVADALGEPCHRLPLPLHVCPTCSAGIKPSRGWTWVAPAILGDGCETSRAFTLHPPRHCRRCVVCTPDLLKGERAGLLWIGESFYPTPEHFLQEAAHQGVSRRIKCVPKGFVLGETWVLMAHRKAIKNDQPTGGKIAEVPAAVEVWTPGIVTCFRPKRVELVLRQSDATAERVAEEAERGVTVVPVPDGDPDHDPKGPNQQKDLFEEV